MKRDMEQGSKFRPLRVVLWCREGEKRTILDPWTGCTFCATDRAWKKDSQEAAVLRNAVNIDNGLGCPPDPTPSTTSSLASSAARNSSKLFLLSGPQFPHL